MLTNSRKLRTLRARTDSELVLLIHRELDCAAALLGRATTRISPLFAQAEKAFGTAALLARVASLNEEERRRMVTRIDAIRLRMSKVPAAAAA